MIKKLLKKMTGIFLIISILITSLPIDVRAYGPLDDPLYFEDFEELDDIASIAPADMDKILDDFVIDASNYFKKSTDTLNTISGNTSKTLDELNKIANGLKTSKIMTSFQFVSYATGIISNITSILKTFGIMEDPIESKLDSILDAVKSIQNDVKEINKKVTEIQNTLSKQFADTKYSLDLIRAKQLQSSWADFLRNEYEPFMEFIDQYNYLFNTHSINWVETWKSESKSDLRSLYSKKGLLMLSSNNYLNYKDSLPVVPDKSDDTENIGYKTLDTKIAYNIVLPSSYLSIDSKVSIDANNYEKIFNETILNGVKRAVDDGVIKLDEESLPFWNVKNVSEDYLINKIADDLVNSLYYEINSTIANSDAGGGISFASKAVTLFKRFCGAIKGDNNIGSAIVDLYDSLKLTFAFEGEAKEYANRYYLLVGSATIQFGSLTSTLLASSKAISSNTKTEIGNLMADTLKMNSDIHDDFITGHDNFCYPLNGLLNYVDVSAQTVTQTNTKHYIESGFDFADQNVSYVDWVVVDASSKLNKDNLQVYEYEAKRNENALKSAMLNEDQLTYLSHYISASESNNSIMEYLKTHNVIQSDGNHSDIILTPSFEIKDQPLDSTILQSTPFASDWRRFDRYYDDSLLPGYEKGEFKPVIKEKNYKTVVHTKLVGKTFSLDGKFDTSDASNSSVADDISSRFVSDYNLGKRVLQYYESGYATPRYLLTDEATVTLDISEAATDTKEFYYKQPYRSMFTATAEKKYGALVLNYNKDNSSNSYSLVIKNKDEFLTFLKKISSGNTFENQSILLNSNIDLNGVNLENYWTAENYDKQFRGHFNGNGKTISNLTIKSSNHRVALFRTTGNGAIIENLKLKNVNISGSANKNGYAALVGYAADHLIIDNVEVVSGTITGYKYVGGIVGEGQDNKKVNILNCINNATIVSNDTDAGGILGNVGNYYVYNSVNNGNVEAKRGAAGGITGYNGSDNKNVSSFIRNSKNTGNITGYDCAGGMTGHIRSNDRFSTFINNENTGNIISTQTGAAGGITGYTQGGGTYIGNKNSGEVKTNGNYAGGILGQNEDDLILLKNNINSGNVTGNNKTGGIAGYLGDRDLDNIVEVINNVNSGRIEALSSDNGDCGGIIGSIYTDNVNHLIKDNSNTGEVFAARQAGGIVGYMAGGGIFANNSNKNDITSYTQNAGAIVGSIQDDKCTFKGSNVYNPHIIIGENIGTSYVKYDYKVKTVTGEKRAARICGWDGNSNKSINEDTLLATIFGSGNIVLIIVMSILVVVVTVLLVIIKKKSDKIKKTIKKVKKI